MPVKVKCKAPGCCLLVDKYSGHKYCEKHRALEIQEAQKRKPYATAKHNQWEALYHSKEWKQLKSAQLEKQPRCEICGEAATEVHHITPHNGVQELFLDPYNLMSLCHICHLRETQKESWDIRRQAAKEAQAKRRKLWY